jgi:hypothetical protein
LKVSGEIGGSGVTVRSNATLGGAGIIYANVTTLPGGLIAPGGLSTLIVNGNLTSAGGFAIELNRYAYPNSSGLVVSGTLTQTGPGTLTVSNAGVELVEGDTFQLFNGSALIGGSALTITPAPGAGLVWSNSLAVDGSIVAVAAPANITYSVSGGQITLAWPDKYLGWNLQAQTNQLNVGLSTNWVAIPGTETVTSTNLPVDPANPAVFYRLRSP